MITAPVSELGRRHCFRFSTHHHLWPPGTDGKEEADSVTISGLTDTVFSETADTQTIKELYEGVTVTLKKDGLPDTGDTACTFWLRSGANHVFATYSSLMDVPSHGSSCVSS